MKKITAYKGYYSDFMSKLSEQERKKIKRALLLLETEDKIPSHYIKFIRDNPEAVKENIKKKFQDSKLPLVDEVIELDAEVRKAQQEADDIRASRNKISKEIGALMGQGKKRKQKK